MHGTFIDEKLKFMFFHAGLIKLVCRNLSNADGYSGNHFKHGTTEKVRLKIFQKQQCYFF